MASRHTLSLAKALVRSQTALGSRGYAASSAAASTSAARTPVRTFRKTSAAAAAPIKPRVTKVEPSTPSVAAVDELPMPVAEAVPDYDKISPPLTSYPSAESGYKSLPSASVSKGIEGEAAVGEDVNDWSTSFKGLSERPFSREAAEHLLAPLKAEDIEIKPDGLLYLPEIKYRRVLNMAFGPGGWGMAPRGETSVGPRLVSREWGLVCLGRLVSIARGEQEYFDPSGVPTATEACKSNALMRCCKDLGIASELWDPSFIRTFKSKHCVEAFVEHQGTKKKRKLWRKKDAKFEYPYKEA